MILFQLYDTKAGLFEGNLLWAGQNDHFPTFILEEKLIKYTYNLMQFSILS